MKKVLAIVLMLVLTFCAAVTVSAAGTDELTAIQKGWVDESGETIESAYPKIGLEFELLEKRVEDATHEAYSVSEEIPDVVISKTASGSDITVSGMDSIKGAGLFEYKVKEIDPQVAGVTANTDEYIVQVLRTFVMVDGKATTDTETSSIAVFKVSGSDMIKVETISNTYVDGDLALDVAVTGNLSNKEDDFTVEITITSDVPVESEVVLPDGTVVEFEKTDDGYVGKATVTISDNDGVKTIAGIPEGVTVTVEEKNPDPYELVDYDTGDKTTTPPTITMSADGASVVITNHRSTEIDTGISLDSLPYILILIAVGGVAAFYIIRKRRNTIDAE